MLRPSRIILGVVIVGLVGVLVWLNLSGTSGKQSPRADARSTSHASSPTQGAVTGTTTTGQHPVIGPTASSAHASRSTAATCPEMVPAVSDGSLQDQVKLFLASYYELMYCDTHDTRLARIQRIQPLAPARVYGELDLSVVTDPDRMSDYDRERVAHQAIRTGTVRTDKMQTIKVSSTDYFVIAPVFVSFNGKSGTTFITNTTWLLKGKTWVINSFSDGGDS